MISVIGQIYPRSCKRFQAALPMISLLHFMETWLEAVSDPDKLVCRGASGRDAVELANAFILSSAREVPATLPLIVWRMKRS